MPINKITESEIEIFSLNEIKQHGFSYIPGPSIAPDVEAAHRILGDRSNYKIFKMGTGHC
jgi:hypothetical protein